ncbi:rhodanese-like domain-containing protein [Candidatus Woesearchaeota archaeon]|nr:rhodanese-like domain-containing protein [Candidatus Woesearchaeota archaeon]
MIKRISQKDFLTLLENEKNFPIFDFREQNFFVQEYIIGSINLPLATLQLSSDELYEHHKKHPVYIIGDHEGCATLEKRGFQHIFYVGLTIPKDIPIIRLGGLRHA